MDSQNSSLSDDFYTSLADDNIFDQMGFKNLTDEKKKELMEVMVKTIRGRVIAQIYDKLDQSKRDELEKISSEDKSEELDKFFETNSIDYNKMMAEQALIYKAEMIENANMLKNQLANNNPPVTSGVKE